jgi:hypothetical protein
VWTQPKAELEPTAGTAQDWVQKLQIAEQNASKEEGCGSGLRLACAAVLSQLFVMQADTLSKQRRTVTKSNTYDGLHFDCLCQ